MSQSLLFQPCTLFRLRSTAIITSSLILLTTSLTAKLPAEGSAVLSHRHISVTCDLKENQPAGTLITRLLDHDLTLKNFRAAESESDPVFSVDPDDGSVRIDREDQIDFESHRSLRLLVSADAAPTEHDRFLDQFSAGLLEDGLLAGEYESLSSGTVTIDITIRLRDVPEPPTLADVNLMVQVFDESPTEFGKLAAAGSQSSEKLHYFIISGNEDDLFQIDSDTGALSLRRSDALQYDMISTHELQILAENSAGLSATANAVVSVFNETPALHPVAAPVIASIPGVDPATMPSDSEPALSSISTSPAQRPFELTLKLYYEAEFRAPLKMVQSDDRKSTLAGHAPEQRGAVNADHWSVIPHLAAPIPDTGPIDTDQLQAWLTATDNAGQADADHATLESAASTNTEPATVTSEPQHILQSIVALIVFIISCVAVAVALSRASSARRAVREGDAAGHAESLAAEDSNLDDRDSEQPAEFDLAAMQSKQSDTPVVENQKIAALSERICLLQNELAARDQLIADLRAQLRRVCLGLDIQAGVDDESQPDHNEASENNGRTGIPDDFPSMPSVNSLSQILHHVESHAGVCSTLATTQDHPELTGNTQSPQAWNNMDETETDNLRESADFAVATLNEEPDLHSELAELFAVKQDTTEKPPVQTSFSKVEADSTTVDAVVPAEDDEDLHLNTVKQYLSQLLERSKESTSPEDILVDRRKIDNQDCDANRRTAAPPARKPVKSFLESYMSTHGGELSETTGNTFVQTPVEKPELTPLPAKPRTPVDVKSARESMNSFRAVAIQSVENAVLSYDLRQAKGAIAVRTLLLAGLILLTALAILANTQEAIQFSPLPWLMAAVVIFALIELGLRVHSFRKQRKDFVSGTGTSAKGRKNSKIKGHDLDDTLVQ